MEIDNCLNQLNIVLKDDNVRNFYYIIDLFVLYCIVKM